MKNDRVISKMYLVIALVVLFGTNTVNAQDTISDEEITYLFPQPWGGNGCLWYCGFQGGCLALYFYTDTQLPIIGVATSARCRDGSDCAVTLGLWKHLPSGMISLAEGVIDPVFASRYMEVIGGYVGPSGPPALAPQYVPIQETRFDSAIMVQDSFYVSYHSTNNLTIHFPTDEYLGWGLSGEQEGSGIRVARGSLGTNGLSWTFGVTSVDGGHLERLPFLFPIIDTTGMIFPCDTMTCANTSGFHLTAQSGDYATFAWVGAPEHTEWEVSYGPVGTEPGGGRVLHPTTTNVVVSNMRPETHYVAYVRGFCPECKVWSEWSEGVEFWMGMNGGTEGVPIVEQLTYISPNPAHGEVQVFSSFGIRKVSIHNVQGIQVSTRQVPGYSALIDVSTLPTGLYFVNVHTHAGTVTKKLVVE